MDKKILDKINSLRGKPRFIKPQITKDQLKAIELCRDVEPKVSFGDMCSIWEEAGWGTYSKSYFLRLYEKVKRGHYELIDDKVPKKTKNRKP